MGAIIGASWTGKKSMTATSGPGFSLMQENIGYAIMTETAEVLRFRPDIMLQKKSSMLSEADNDKIG